MASIQISNGKVKVGDEVRMVEVPGSGEAEFLGQIGKVVGINMPAGISVKFDNGRTLHTLACRYAIPITPEYIRTELYKATDKPRRALELSLEKWEIETFEGFKDRRKEEASRVCSLCVWYVNLGNGDCGNCPLKKCGNRFSQSLWGHLCKADTEPAFLLARDNMVAKLETELNKLDESKGNDMKNEKEHSGIKYIYPELIFGTVKNGDPVMKMEWINQHGNEMHVFIGMRTSSTFITFDDFIPLSPQPPRPPIAVVDAIYAHDGDVASVDKFKPYRVVDEDESFFYTVNNDGGHTTWDKKDCTYIKPNPVPTVTLASGTYNADQLDALAVAKLAVVKVEK